MIAMELQINAESLGSSINWQLDVYNLKKKKEKEDGKITSPHYAHKNINSKAIKI